ANCTPLPGITSLVARSVLRAMRIPAKSSVHVPLSHSLPPLDVGRAFRLCWPYGPGWGGTSNSSDKSTGPCTDRTGRWLVGRVYVDEGYFRKSLQRPGMQQLLHDAHRGQSPS